MTIKLEKNIEYTFFSLYAVTTVYNNKKNNKTRANCPKTAQMHIK